MLSKKIENKPYGTGNNGVIIGDEPFIAPVLRLYQYTSERLILDINGPAQLSFLVVRRGYANIPVALEYLSILHYEGVPSIARQTIAGAHNHYVSRIMYKIDGNNLKVWITSMISSTQPTVFIPLGLNSPLLNITGVPIPGDAVAL